LYRDCRVTANAKNLLGDQFHDTARKTFNNEGHEVSLRL
jgi:hypothetical protein